MGGGGVLSWKSGRGAQAHIQKGDPNEITGCGPKIDPTRSGLTNIGHNRIINITKMAPMGSWEPKVDLIRSPGKKWDQWDLAR